MTQVRTVKGIPRWFTLLIHYWSRRRCHRIGHLGLDGRPAKFICPHCGQLLNGMTNEQVDLNEAELTARMKEDGL